MKRIGASFLFLLFGLGLGAPLAFGRFLDDFNDFENLRQTVYAEETGKPLFIYSFSRIEKRFPKLKFLTFGLPAFEVKSLKMWIDLNAYDHSKIKKELLQFERKEAVRFVRAKEVVIDMIASTESRWRISCDSLRANREEGFALSHVEVEKNELSIGKFPRMLLILKRGQPGLKILSKEETTPICVVSHK